MADKDRLNRPELQAEINQVSGNTPELVRDVDRASLIGNPATRSRNTFPAKHEGRDGDEVIVHSGGKAYLCRKSRGSWIRLTDSAAVSEEIARISNVTVDKAVSKSGGTGIAQLGQILKVKTETTELLTIGGYLTDEHLITPVLKTNMAYFMEVLLMWDATSGRGFRFRIWPEDGQADIEGGFSANYSLTGATMQTIGAGFISTAGPGAIISSCSGVLMTGPTAGRISIQWMVGAAIAGYTNLRKGSFMRFTEMGTVI